MKWVVLQIKYKFEAVNSSKSNVIVNTKLLTDSTGSTMLFDSFEEAEEYVIPISNDYCSYKYVEVG